MKESDDEERREELCRSGYFVGLSDENRQGNELQDLDKCPAPQNRGIQKQAGIRDLGSSYHDEESLRVPGESSDVMDGSSASALASTAGHDEWVTTERLVLMEAIRAAADQQLLSRGSLRRQELLEAFRNRSWSSTTITSTENEDFTPNSSDRSLVRENSKSSTRSLCAGCRDANESCSTTAGASTLTSLSATSESDALLTDATDTHLMRVPLISSPGGQVHKELRKAVESMSLTCFHDLFAVDCHEGLDEEVEFRAALQDEFSQGKRFLGDRAIQGESSYAADSLYSLSETDSQVIRERKGGGGRKRGAEVLFNIDPALWMHVEKGQPCSAENCYYRMSGQEVQHWHARCEHTHRSGHKAGMGIHHHLRSVILTHQAKHAPALHESWGSLASVDDEAASGEKPWRVTATSLFHLRGDDLPSPRSIKRRSSDSACSAVSDSTDVDGLPAWSPEEDSLLNRLVRQYDNDKVMWSQISHHFAGKSELDCLLQWRRKSNVSARGIGSWSVDEDEYLKLLVEQKGQKWASIAELIPGRVAKQCRERWKNHLDPSLRKDVEWTQEEDARLLRLRKGPETGWASICEHLPGRSYNDVKNRYSLLMRKVLREERAAYRQSSKGAHAFRGRGAGRADGSGGRRISRADSGMNTKSRSLSLGKGSIDISPW